MKFLTFSAAALFSLAHSLDLLPNSCIDLDDGLHWVKLMDGDEYPPVQVQCSNGYVLLDYSQDNNIAEYFDTWTMWHTSTAGPTNDVHVNWEQWFKPSDAMTKYIISPDCDTCHEFHTRQIYDAQTTYWMTGTLFGCFWAVKGAHNCDVDWDTNDCYTCLGSQMQNQGSNRVKVGDFSSDMEWSATGICPHNVQIADHYVPTTHDACTHEESQSDGDTSMYLHLKPSIGTEGEYCVCVQPPAALYYEVDSIPDEPKIAVEDVDDDIYVYVDIVQDDFTSGTYRITKPGTYTVQEDITFDFNAQPTDPFADGAYLPGDEQADDYPGANDYRNAFFLGFFAGITIECDNVILDLNGHTLQMSDYFYYQQRWFTTIELGTQYFLPGQGIGNFGAQPKTASNVIIKDGTLGLTSHHGIHGNYNKDITVSNVHVREFETHGIQFNGFDTITLTDVEVGPTSSKAFFNGEYGHMRLLLPRYKKIAEETSGETIQFYGRDEATTMEEIAEEIELQMNLAWEYVLEGKTVDEDSPLYDSFTSALQLFVNEAGVPNGGAQFGIFLNTFGASVFTYNLYTGFYSEHAKLENVKIHGMRHNMKEYVRLHVYQTGDIIINPFNGPLDLEEMFETTDNFDDPKYKGNILLDAYMASNKLSDNFGYLGLQLILNDKVVAWAEGADFYDSMGSGDNIQIGCNSDVMIHSGKGINGLRLDGVKDVVVKNLEVYDMYDSSVLGKDTCGAYDDFCALCGTTGGHFRQTQPMQIGFTGNMIQAINVNAAEDVVFEDINIHDLTSETGPAYGISIWPACDVNLRGEIKVENLKAGSEIEKGTFDYIDRPNKAPEVCGVRVHWVYSSYTTTLSYDGIEMSTKCLDGHVGCHGSTAQRNMINDATDMCEDDSYDINFQVLELIVDDEDSDDTPRKQARPPKKASDSESFADAGAATTTKTSSSYIPKQTITTMMIELAILCLILYGGYRFIMNNKARARHYKLLENHDLSHTDYGTENTVF